MARREQDEDERSTLIDELQQRNNTGTGAHGTLAHSTPGLVERPRNGSSDAALEAAEPAPTTTAPTMTRRALSTQSARSASHDWAAEPEAAPNVLLERVLRLRSDEHEHEHGDEDEGERESEHARGVIPQHMKPRRSASLMSVLTGASGSSRAPARTQQAKDKGRAQTPRLESGPAAIAPGGASAAEGNAEREDAADEATPLLANIKRSSRSRSASTRRTLPWWRRPSPLWFLPGTLFMATSMAMVMSPKIEIYNQLVCRAMSERRQRESHEVGTDHGNSDGGASTIFPFVQLGIQLDDQLDSGGDTWLELATAASESEDPDDKWARECRRAPAVQKAVAQLQTTLTLLMGVLAAITTGYWGSLSDRRGRKPILTLALIGMLSMDLVFILTVKYHDVLGYRFLVVGPLIDGSLGGYTTALAAINAYISDCTESGSRVRVFSLIGSLMFAGIALGPSLGALCIRLAHSVLAPFYASLGLHAVYLLALLLVIPESLSLDRQRQARARASEEATALASDRANAPWPRKIMLLLLRPFSFLAPLALLLPRRRGPGEKDDDRPQNESRGEIARGWDWNLTKVGLGYFAYTSVMGIMAIKVQYTGITFEWGPQENGYYLSFIGLARVVALLVILPLGIKLIRNAPPAPTTPRPAPPPASSDANATKLQALHAEDVREWDAEARYLRVVHDSHFDLGVVRMSIIIDLVGYALLATNAGSIRQFLVATAITCVGSGAGPAMQSLALSLTSPRDSGRLFASLSVLQSLSAQVAGPLMFASVFMRAVDVNYPELIFWVAVALFAFALVTYSLVRLRRVVVRADDGETAIVRETHLPPNAVAKKHKRKHREAPRRGRSQTRKYGTLAESTSNITLRSSEGGTSDT